MREGARDELFRYNISIWIFFVITNFVLSFIIFIIKENNLTLSISVSRFLKFWAQGLLKIENFCINQKCKEAFKKKPLLENFFCRADKRGDMRILKKWWWILGRGGSRKNGTHAYFFLNTF